MSGGRGVRLGVDLCAALVVALGCSTPVVQEAGLYRHRELGYAIAAPPGPDGYWSFTPLSHADLGFRGVHGETMSLASRCGRPTAPAKVMARHLRFGLAPHSVQRSGAVRVAGAPAWMQILEVSSGSATVGVKTVTLVLRNCIFDFVLAARTRFEEAERAFDGWLQTFLPGEAGLPGDGR